MRSEKLKREDLLKKIRAPPPRIVTINKFTELNSIGN